MRLLLITIGVLLMSLGSLSAATTTVQSSGGGYPPKGALDPAVVGIWVPYYHGNAPDISNYELDIFADGSVIKTAYSIKGNPLSSLYVPVKSDGTKPHLKWIINGTILSAMRTDTGTANYGNGRFYMQFPNGDDLGDYSLNANQRVLTLTAGTVQFQMKKVADATGKMLVKPQPPAAPLTSGGVDSNLAGLWVERIPMPDKGYTMGTIFEIHPNGQFIAHFQHIAQGQDLNVGNDSADVETDTAQIQAANGRYIVTSPDGTTGSASYVFDHAKTKMIVMYDKDTYGYLFVRMGDIGNDDSLSVSSGFSDLEAVHVVDPKLVRVWIGGLQNADGSITYKLMECHPNGDFVLHVRTVTGTQSVMDVKDSETYPGQIDAFSGRFLMNEPNDLRETGVYSFKYGTPNGTELDLCWDTDKTTLNSYRVFGDFDANGAMRPLPAAK